MFEASQLGVSARIKEARGDKTIARTFLKHTSQ